MVIILLFGLLGLLRLNVQSLPDFGFDLITVSVDWKSASPRDIENQVIKSIEPEVLACDHDLETNQWLLYQKGIKDQPSQVIARYRY